MTRRSLVGHALACPFFLARAQESKPPPRPRPIDAPFDVVAPVPPTAFQAGGKTHLVYEIHLTNFGRQELTLTRLEVPSLASFSGDELAGLVMRPGITTKDPLKIEAGLRAVLFLWITPSEVPPTLEHRLTFKSGDDELTLLCAHIPVHKPAIAINPPLRCGEWLAGNGPSNTSGHRRSPIPVGGGVHIAQRFAIDWLQLRDDGNSFTGDRLDNKNYRCYGQDALAVADANVVAVKDGIPENIPGANSRAAPITLETVGGNHPDGNSPLGSEGLPYAFRSFEVQGQGVIESGHWAWKPFTAPVQHSNELPRQNQVVRFS